MTDEITTTTLTGWTCETHEDLTQFFEDYENGTMPEPEPIILYDDSDLLTVDEMFGDDGIAEPFDVEAETFRL